MLETKFSTTILHNDYIYLARKIYMFVFLPFFLQLRYLLFCKHFLGLQIKRPVSFDAWWTEADVIASVPIPRSIPK